ncbi:MAG: methionine--tRNA ligase subunit beta [Candidatus Nitrosocosmicus sp.]|nr:methionine--tRNA ligase subunit beta [Candidatus Nitrosocosmicus sp.]
MSEIKNKISFDEFSKVELRVGKILSAENMPGYKKILRLVIDLGGEEREIMSGLAKHYQPEEIINKNVVVCTNLEPRKFGDQVSDGMVLAASNENGRPILLTVIEETIPGSHIT